MPVRIERRWGWPAMVMALALVAWCGWTVHDVVHGDGPAQHSECPLCYAVSQAQPPEAPATPFPILLSLCVVCRPPLRIPRGSRETTPQGSPRAPPQQV